MRNMYNMCKLREEISNMHIHFGIPQIIITILLLSNLIVNIKGCIDEKKLNDIIYVILYIVILFITLYFGGFFR